MTSSTPACPSAVRSPAYRLSAKRTKVPIHGTYSALVVFAKFHGEAPGEDTAPQWSADLFRRTVPGSFAHFYAEMSHGLLQVQGQVLPRRYSSRDPATAYLAANPAAMGRFGRFNLEILAQADADADFGLCDNDGPDGVPNSGDDDGYVDIVFINLLTVPRYFLVDRASGYASLNLDTDYISNDPAAGGGYIRVRSRFNGFGGTTQRGHTFQVTAATMCHEFGHVLGLVDLFDQSSIGAGGELEPAEESAGIGKWGLMGLGTLGWGTEDGPNAFCAWSLAQLGWVEVVDITDEVKGLSISDAVAGQRIYRIPLSRDEYFLLENRQAAASYYNRNVPASGLLIWHVDERADNDAERHKQVDLVCADGLYADRGYPGARPDPVMGGDNLDYYARDAAYRDAHHGNQGDATDPYDGIRFTRFAYDTNPRAAAYTGDRCNLPMGIVVDHIRPEGRNMVVDVQIRHPLMGHVSSDTTWSGVVDVIGDVVVDPGACLTLAAGTQVRFASFDWYRSGFDDQHCELLVYGGLVTAGSAESPVTLSASDPRAQWSGVYLLDGQNPSLEALVLEGSIHGLVRQRLPAGITHWEGVRDIPMDLLVPADAELVVAPDTRVRFGWDSSWRGAAPMLTELDVEGTLRIAAEAGHMATFTAAGDEEDAIWYGVRLGACAHVAARQLLLERAGFGFSGPVGPEGSLYLGDSRIRQTAVSALQLSISGQAVLERCVLRWNRIHGLRVEGDGRLLLRDVDIVDNGKEGMFVGNASVDAQRVVIRANGVLDAADPRSGMVAVGGGGQQLRLRDCQVDQNRLHGLELDTWEGKVSVVGSMLSGNRRDGLRALASAGVTLSETQIRDQEGRGVLLRGTPSSVRFTRFVGNGVGLRVESGPLPRPLERNVFLGNGVAVDNASGRLLDAAANYWGSSDSTLIAAQIVGPVRFMPFLTTEPDPTAIVAQATVPSAFRLGAAYPNPFNGQVRIPFATAAPGLVELVVFDALGRPLRTLVAQCMEAGAHLAIWDGRDERGAPAASGLYLCRLRAETQEAGGRILLLR